MLSLPNALQWGGQRGRYEVYYVTVTDPGTGVGIWLRFSLLAPAPGGGATTAAVWLLAMDPRPGRPPVFGRKHTFPIESLHAQADPFRLEIGAAVLSDHGTSGAFDDVEWELRWAPGERRYEHVHPILRRAAVAKTVLVLPHADLSIDGTVSAAGAHLALSAARGAQAHLWGSKHASSWAWVHCNDFFTADGRPAPGVFVDGVSVRLPRAGREGGPTTPVVGRIDGRDFRSTSPLRVLTNPSTFALTGWRFEAVDGQRKLIGQVDARRSELAGVTYHDPDGERAYCYNTEVASMRLHVLERSRRTGGWSHRSTLRAPGRAHFEYAQRSPVPEIELVIE